MHGCRNVFMDGWSMDLCIYVSMPVCMYRRLRSCKRSRPLEDSLKSILSEEPSRKYRIYSCLPLLFFVTPTAAVLVVLFLAISGIASCSGKLPGSIFTIFLIIISSAKVLLLPSVK